jgi:tetratricopeptide (TPR) repeat protein
MSAQPGKPYKEKDLVTRTRMFSISAWVFPFLALIGLIGGYLYYGAIGAIVGIVLALAVSVLVAAGTMATTGSIGGLAVDLLYGRRRGLWSLREQLEGPLRQARTQFEAEQFEQALKTVNQIIEKDPKYPEALILKGQILWEGFHNAHTSKPYLLRAIALEPDEASAIHLQAASLINDIKIYDGPTTHLPETEGQEQIAALHRDPSDKRFTAVARQKARRQISITGTDQFLLYGIIIWCLLMTALLWHTHTHVYMLGTAIHNADTNASQLQKAAERQRVSVENLENAFQDIEKNVSSQ